MKICELAFKGGKTPPGSSNHLFFIRPKRLCIISLFISCWLAVINASFVETIKLLNFRSAGFVKQSTLDFHRFGIVNCLGEVHMWWVEASGGRKVTFLLIIFLWFADNSLNSLFSNNFWKFHFDVINFANNHANYFKIC